MRWSMPRIQAGRVAELAGPVAGGQDDGGGAVGDRRAVVPAQRRHDLGLLQQHGGIVGPLQLGVGVVGGGARLRAAISASSLVR